MNKIYIKEILTYQCNKTGSNMEILTEIPLMETPTVNSTPVEVTKKPIIVKTFPLTTKKAVEYLLAGTLKDKVCRSCLKVTPLLTSMSDILEVANDGAFYQVSIEDMIASFYPHEISKDADLPNKICDKCLNKTISAYIFNQQYKQSEQSLRSCIIDVYENMNLLDPLERGIKRGRQKLNVNHNILNVTHKFVKHYAQPLIQLVKTASADNTIKALKKYECPKCWEILPSLATFMRHEKTHPKDMWFRCRFCGLSYAKKITYKRHIRTHESKPSSQFAATVPTKVDETFKCETCDEVSENYIYHLQHLEKHKFKRVMKSLLYKNEDLCMVCLENGKHMVDANKSIALHGGHQELMGDHSVNTILASALPDMNSNAFLGTKICEKCLDAAINAYIFTNKSRYTRRRLDLCLTQVLDNLEDVKFEHNVIVEIPKTLVMPVKESDILKDGITAFLEDLDETKLKAEVLEDKYRVESDDDKNKVEENNKPKKEQATKINGIANVGKNMDVSEFLTFKTKKVLNNIIKFTCPLCNKYFVSEYFLKNHALTHKNSKVSCKICKRQFKSKFSLKEHKRMAHILNRSHVSCKTCCRAFESEYLLNKHKQSHKRKQCQLCDKYFRSQRFYENHLQRHAMKLARVRQRKTQNCSFCETEYSNRNELNIHMNKIHLQIKPYQCDMCNSQFYTQTNLHSHKKLHNLYSKEKCQFCDKSLFSRKSLVVHLRKHMNSKPIKCSVCEESFYSEYGRNKHMNKIHGGRFVCKLCRTALAGRSELKNHVEKAHVLGF